MTEPEYEQNRKQIRNALYGVSGDMRQAAKSQERAVAGMERIAHKAETYATNTDALFQVLWTSFAKAHYVGRTRNAETADQLEAATSSLQGVMTSGPGNAVLGELAARQSEVGANDAELDADVYDFSGISAALDGLRAALRAKSEEVNEAANEAAGLEGVLREVGRLAEERAQDF